MDKEKIKEIVSGAFPEMGIVIREVSKNGQKVTGISLVREGINGEAMPYLEDFSGTDEEIAEDVVRVLKEHMNDHNGMDYSEFTEWGKAKKTVIPTLVNARVNADQLNELVHTPMGDDLAVTYRVVVNVGNTSGSVHVTKDHLKGWEITQEELDEAARKNLEGVSVVESIENMLNVTTCASGSTPKLMVVTNKTKYYGAASILSSSVQKKLREVLETYYVIPSSINEVICVPQEADPAGLKRLLMKINRTQIPAEVFLSDNIYVQYSDGFLQVVETKNAVNA